MSHEPSIDKLISRRSFLAQGALVGVGAVALLNGCGSSSSSQMAKGSGEVGGQFDFLSWQGYDLPVPLMDQWRKSNNVTMRKTFIASQNDVQGKLKGGQTGVDISNYLTAYGALYQELGIVQTLDPDRIPNLKNLLPFFASDTGDFWIDKDGNRVAVPWSWGYDGLTYDTSQIKEPTSWYDLLDPKLAGKVGIADSPVDIIGITCHILGFKPTTVTPEQKTEIIDFLDKIVAQARTVAPSYGDLASQFVSGEIVAAYAGWAAVDNFAADQGKKTIRTILPKEGAGTFAESYFIPVGADNVSTAYSWMNKVLEPKVNAQINDSLLAGVTVSGAIKLQDPELAKKVNANDIDALLEKAPLFTLPPTSSSEYMTLSEWFETWNSIKAGS